MDIKNKYPKIIGYNKCRDDKGNILYCSNTTTIFALGVNGEIFVNNGFNPKIKIETIDDLLSFNLQMKKITGLYPEEVLAKTYSIPEIDKNKIVELDFIRELDTTENKSGSDFMVAPIYKEGHFVSAIVHFLNPPQNNRDREIFVFDSQQENNVPYIGICDGLIENPQLLNIKNLQGKSGTCGYFTAEFIAQASKASNFQELHNYCASGQMQHHVYDKVKAILNRNGKDLDKLRNINQRIALAPLDDQYLRFGKTSNNKLLSSFKRSSSQPAIRQKLLKALANTQQRQDEVAQQAQDSNGQSKTQKSSSYRSKV